MIPKRPNVEMSATSLFLEVAVVRFWTKQAQLAWEPPPPQSLPKLALCQLPRGNKLRREKTNKH